MQCSTDTLITVPSNIYVWPDIAIDVLLSLLMYAHMYWCYIGSIWVLVPTGILINHFTLIIELCLVQGACVCMSCSLQSIKSTETRGVKTFPTKTSRDVGMVHCISETTGSCMEKLTGTKRPRTRRCICNILATQVNIRRLQDTYFAYVVTIPTSGNS